MSPAPRPRWYVDVPLPGDFLDTDFSPTDYLTGGTLLLGTADSDRGAAQRHGLVVSGIEITQRQSDPIFRDVQSQRVAVELANANGVFTTPRREFRGAPITVWRADDADGYLARRFDGQVAQPAIGEVVTLECADVKGSVLDTDIPKGTITAEAFPGAVDIGAPLLVVFGNATNVPLYCIRDDRVNSIFYYLAPRAAGGGALTFNGLKRDGVGGQQFASIHTSEYTVLTLPEYPGFTVIRFPVRQQRHGSDELHLIYADISTAASDRNPSYVRRMILTNTAWGLGQTVNVASFDAAATAITAEGNLFCDGVLGLDGPMPAREALRLLGMFLDQWLTLNAAGEWVEHVDAKQTAVDLVLRDGPGDGVRNLVAVGDLMPRATEELIRAVSIAYRPGFDGVPRHTITRPCTLPLTVNGATHGSILTLDCGRWVTNHTTADKLAYRRAARVNFSDYSIRVSCLQDARAIEYGDLVSLTYAPRNLAGAICEVFALTDRLTQIDLELWVGTQALYDAIYAYVAGTLPTDSAIDPITDFSHTAPAAPTGLSIVGDGVRMSTDGVAKPYVVLRFTVPATNFNHAVVFYAPLGDPNAASVGPVYGSGTVDYLIEGVFTPGIQYAFRPESVNATGLTSAPAGPVVSWLAPGDRNGPALPSGFVAQSQKLTTATLVWVAPADKDVRGYNWQRHSGPNGTGTLLASGFVEGTTLTVEASAVGYGVATYHRIQAVDFTGNVSGIVNGAGTPTWTASVGLTFTQIVTIDLGAGQVTEPIIGGGAVTTPKRQALLLLSQVYNITTTPPGGPFSTSGLIGHALGVIPNVTADAGHPRVFVTLTNITTSTLQIGAYNTDTVTVGGTFKLYFW